MKKRIGVLGSGVVGTTLARAFDKLGYEVMLGNRAGKAVENWEGKTGKFSQAADFSDLLIFAIKGSAAESLAISLRTHLAGKTIIDTTNPIADSPPEDGVLKYFTSLDESLMELLQNAVPEAHFVKAFSSAGYATMVNPSYQGGKPTMFICGNDAGAKEKATQLLVTLGWEVEDFGGVKSARAIEPLCMLWCIPGFLRNEWSHAFKLLH